MCQGCGESDRVQLHGRDPADPWSWWCNRCLGWVPNNTPRPGRHTPDFEGPPLARPSREEVRRKAREHGLQAEPMQAAAETPPAEAPRFGPVDYWRSPCKLSLELQDGSKVSADWDPRSRTLRLHGPFGAAVLSPFERTDNAGLHSCALAAAEQAALRHKMTLGGEQQQPGPPASFLADAVPPPLGATLTACKSCAAPIFYAVSAKGKPMPIDTRPVEGGNVVIFAGDGFVRAKVLTRKQMEGGGIVGPRYRSHFASCSAAAKHRRKQPCPKQ